MDIVAHALWANLAAELVTRKRKTHLRRRDRASAMLGAVAPDLIAFMPYLLVSLFGTGGLLGYALHRFGQEWGFAWATTALTGTPQPIPEYLSMIYSYTHSGLLWGLAALAVYLITRRMSYFLLGWGTHIALDVFTHDAGHFPTKLLYPLSDFHINATAWSNPVVFVGTYVALLLCYLAVYTRRTNSS